MCGWVDRSCADFSKEGNSYNVKQIVHCKLQRHQRLLNNIHSLVKQIWGNYTGHLLVNLDFGIFRFSIRSLMTIVLSKCRPVDHARPKNNASQIEKQHIFKIELLGTKGFYKE